MAPPWLPGGFKSRLEARDERKERERRGGAEVAAFVCVAQAGPVGPGDKVGSANKSLLMATCRADGLLLKPGYPATSAPRPLRNVPHARRTAGIRSVLL